MREADGMRLRLKDLDGNALRRGLRLTSFIVLASVALLSASARAGDTPPIPPATDAAPAAVAGEMTMHSAGWLERIIVDLEREARSDISMLPDTLPRWSANGGRSIATAPLSAR